MPSLRKFRLSFQITVSMVTAAIVVGVLSGEFARRIETNQLRQDLQEQAELTVSLLSGLMLEAIIVEDIPLINTALEEAVNRTPKLLSITVLNEVGNEITRYPNSALTQTSDITHFDQGIFLEGEDFGSMKVIWSTREGIIKVQKNVRQTQQITAATLLALSMLFLLLTSRLATKPLFLIHNRMQATIAGNAAPDANLSKFVAREFATLDASVDTLESALRERDEREHALNTAMDAATSASRAKSEFLATMSHEIRTPMNGVIGMAELILETELTHDQRLYAETISKSGSALLTIINDILDFSKIEAGKLELDTAPLDLQRTLEDVVTLVATKGAQKNVEVTLRYDPDMPTDFIGDEGRIRQVLTNIVGNAVKFTLQGHVAVNVSGKNSTNGTEIEVSVKDTGVGIPEDKIDKIFKEFEQSDSSSNRKFEGTGLGLAISTRLIKLMHGEIKATSILDQGSTFTIRLFLKPDLTSTKAPEEFSEYNGNHRILIVDDLEINRTILSERLRSWKIQHDVACSAAEALSLLDHGIMAGSPYSLLITDFQMPEMNGKELAAKIRKSPQYANIPMIILSSVDDSINLRSQKELNFSDVLLKPVPSRALNNALNKALCGSVIIPQKPILDQKPREPNNPPPLQKTNTTKILVAEDNKTNQLVIKSMLKKVDCELVIANNGREARDQFLEVSPDIIFMDVSMPEIDGLQATREIRDLEKLNTLVRCPIIALTANAMSGDRERCLEAGMDDYLSKPIDKVRLIDTLTNWTDTPDATMQPNLKSA